MYKIIDPSQHFFSSRPLSALGCESWCCWILRRPLVTLPGYCLKSSWVFNKGSYGHTLDLVFTLRPFLTFRIFCIFSKFFLKIVPCFLYFFSICTLGSSKRSNGTFSILPGNFLSQIHTFISVTVNFMYQLTGPNVPRWNIISSCGCEGVSGWG